MNYRLVNFNIYKRYCVQLTLVIQLAGITGNRLFTLLAFRYQYIKMTLLEDPNGGEQPRMLIEIVFNHIKGYFGEKDTYVFILYITSIVISKLTNLVVTNSGFRTSRTSYIYCFVLILLCSFYSSRTKLLRLFI